MTFEARWYDASFRFVVYRQSLPFGGVDEATATASFGAPAHRYDVDGYRVLVFAHPLHVPLSISPASTRTAGLGEGGLVTGRPRVH